MRLAALTTLLATLAVFPCTSFQRQDLSLNGGLQPQEALTITLESILNFLGKHGGHEPSEAIAIKLIEIYGLGFRPTPEDLDMLRKASASEDLLRAIGTANLPPIPVVKEGRLAVGCVPVDCDVWLNGKLIGSTSQGEMPWTTLPEGPVTVSATRANYDPSESKQDVLIQQDELTRVKFQFKISRAGLMEVGAKLFQQMRHSMHISIPASGDPGSGGLGDPISETRSNSRPAGNDAPERVEIVRDSHGLRAAGTLYLHDPGGHTTVWSVSAWFREGNEARFELSRLREKYVLNRTTMGSFWDRSPPTPEARELEGAIQLVMDGQLSKVMERLDAPDWTMVAVDAPAGTEGIPIFRAEGRSQAYLITLDAAYRPNEIKVESPILGSGLKMLYSDYVREATVYYPKTTQIILPNGAQGVEARFDTVQIDFSQHSYKQVPAKHSKLR
jgi:hypothetical protein